MWTFPTKRDSLSPRFLRDSRFPYNLGYIFGSRRCLSAVQSGKLKIYTLPKYLAEKKLKKSMCVSWRHCAFQCACWAFANFSLALALSILSPLSILTTHVYHVPAPLECDLSLEKEKRSVYARSYARLAHSSSFPRQTNRVFVRICRPFFVLCVAVLPVIDMFGDRYMCPPPVVPYLLQILWRFVTSRKQNT